MTFSCCCAKGKPGQVLQAGYQEEVRLRSEVTAHGSHSLFPSPGRPERSVRYEEASAWLRETERLAGLEPQEGTLWHAYRRLWATARKDLPDVDVAQYGGWASLEALTLAYQQPDDRTMLRVAEHATEVREIK